ncbi:hypothetical protein A4G19_09120 [Pasteurellaceae bacterium Macca]|nr:hypothetical protein [Pasteurellaceae bacterium Macca]
MKKDIFLEKTNRYISVTSYLIGRLRFANPNQDVSYLDLDVSYIEFGKKIRDKLNESREISEDTFMYYFNNRVVIDEFLDKEEKRIKKVYGYKSIKEIYKEISFLSVHILNDTLYIAPNHQDSLDGYTSVRDKNGNAIEFEYPINLTDEALGKAVMQAFEYCTSIYRK